MTSIQNILDTIRPGLVAVDILIVAYIIYRGYVLLSRTRAMQLLIGFALILFLDVAARRLQLETVSWLITNVSSYLVFGLIVLLQPELRRLVAEIGRMRVFQWINPIPAVPLDEIAEAARNMAASRTGSIIIIQKNIRLQSIIESAVRIDAVVTKELLETIFHKDTPLHDGAVIVEGNRIVAASAYLPLSSSRYLKKTHGARHRAGMGISEESDAVVVVTSEETGRISLMMNGELRTPIKASELKETVHAFLTDTTIAKPKDAADEKKEPAREDHP